jgi:hypothetical protein
LRRVRGIPHVGETGALESYLRAFSDASIASTRSRGTSASSASVTRPRSYVEHRLRLSAPIASRGNGTRLSC